MKVGTYLFTCRFESEAFLPAFKGSTLRGGFGHALKQTICALRQQECSTCMLAASCGYAFLFEVQNGNASRRPHPYIIIPPGDDWRFRDKGGSLNFSIALFGKANDYLPHIVYAIREMGQAGIGKKKATEGKFRLVSVHQHDRVIYEGKTLHNPTDLAELTLSPDVNESATKIILTCLTPLRLKYDNQLQDGLPFHVLIRAALRRISSLEKAYGAGEPQLDYKGLAARAAEVQAISTTCRWTEIERYSNRQKTAMFIGGIQGQIAYQGEHLGEFIPLLHYCETVNLGKQTSFGLGQIRIATGT